jgi:ABC-type Fe3+ transport system permease subunit
MSEAVKDGTRRSVRTFIQSILGIVATVLVAVPLATPFITEWFPGSPVLLWLAVGSAFAAGLSATVAKIMAVPAIDRWLDTINLGKDATPARHRAE